MKAIKGFEGLYSITKDGRVLSHKKMVKVGNNGGVETRPEQWLKPSILKRGKGYLRVHLAKNGKKHARLVHRLIAEAFIPNPSNLPQVNHKDGNSLNNLINNLEWCTPQQNSIHAFKNGLTKLPKQCGANNSQAKLTNDLVQQMRDLYAEIGNASEVARRFGIKPRHAYDICHFKRWTHI
jgi:hypothetical protein